MKPKTQIWLVAGLLCFLLIGLAHTLLNANNWPFCSYNMYSYQVDELHEEYMVAVTEDDQTRQVVRPGNVLPIEYYRIPVMFSDLFGGMSEEKKAAFFEKTLRRLNEQPWGSFDEILAAARPKSGKRFTGIEVLKYRYKMSDYAPGKPFVPDTVRVEYRYPPGR